MLRRMKTNVSVGLGTLVGYGLTMLGAAGAAWATAEGASAHIAPGLLAVLTVVSGTLTTLGRMYQAAQGSEPASEVPVAPAPAVFESVPPPAV